MQIFLGASCRLSLGCSINCDIENVDLASFEKTVQFLINFLLKRIYNDKIIYEKLKNQLLSQKLLIEYQFSNWNFQNRFKIQTMFHLFAYIYQCSYCFKYFYRKKFRKVMQTEKLLEYEPALRYSDKESVLINIQTDTQFIADISQIAEKKKATLASLLDNKNITDEQCDQIHQKAVKHKDANIFNLTSVLSPNQIEDNLRCKCCNRGNGSLFPLCHNQQTLTFLGPGVILFFFYLRQIRLTVALVFSLYGAYSLVTNLINLYSKGISTTCPLGYQYFYCIYNESSTFDNKKQYVSLQLIQLWLGLVFCIIWICSIKFITYLGELKDQHIDDLLDSASDYTIRIENLPAGQYEQSELYQFLNEMWEMHRDKNNIFKGRPLNLKSIQIVYNMQQCRDLIQDIKLRAYNLQKFYDGKISKQLKANYQNQISRIIKPDQVDIYRFYKSLLIQKFEKLEDLRRKFIVDKQFRGKLSTTCALIEFRGSQQQNQFLNLLNPKSSNCLMNSISMQNHRFKNSYVAFTRAPQPSDLNWLNCEKKFSYWRYTMIWVITLFIVAVSSSLIYYMQTLTFMKSVNAVLIAITLQLFNRLIWITLSYLVNFQNNNTKTDAIISLMKKSIFAQALNIIVGPIITTFVNRKSLYGSNGLANIVLYYQFIMFIMMLFYYVINPFYLTKWLIINVRCLRNKMIKHLCQVVGQLDTDEQYKPVLTYYQGPQFPIAGGYVYMCTAIFHSMFYCHIHPTILLILIFNITGFYYIMKYLLLRRCKIPQLTQLQVFQCAMFAVGCGAAFYGVGSFFFLIVDQPSKSLGSLQYIGYLPSALCVAFWFISFFNTFGWFQKIFQWVIEYLGFKQKLFSSKKKQNINVSQIFALIMKANNNASDYFQNKAITRKQSYYKYSHVNKLLQFQEQLKELQNKQGYVRRSGAQEFCQGFFKKGNKHRRKRIVTMASQKMSYPHLIIEDCVSLEENQILIPVTKISEKGNLRETPRLQILSQFMK